MLEAPAGSVKALADALKARVIAVGLATSPPSTRRQRRSPASIVTRVPASDAAAVSARAGVLAVLAEDRMLAAPSVRDIAAALNARWLTPAKSHGSFDRVMIGTVSSDAASPYFGNRERTCVITRFDKTDIQLAALQTDIECLVITGGGEPSPYLIDRVRGTRDEIAVLLARRLHRRDDAAPSSRSTAPAASTAHGKLARAVELLDEAGAPVESASVAQPEPLLPHALSSSPPSTPMTLPVIQYSRSSASSGDRLRDVLRRRRAAARVALHRPLRAAPARRGCAAARACR